MKISPINFTTYIESPLIRYWKDHSLCKGQRVEIQRTHNLGLAQTVLNAIATDEQGTSTLLGSIQLIQIPQQEHNPALNGLIHLPHLDRPTQMLMVFKSPKDPEKWSERLIATIEKLMATAPEPSTMREQEEPVEPEQEEVLNDPEDPGSES